MKPLPALEVQLSRARPPAPRSRSPGATWLALAIASLLSAPIGCGRTALDVVVESELVVPEDVDALSLRVWRGDVEVEQRYPLEGPRRSLAETITLLPGARLRDEVQVRATAWLGDEEAGSVEDKARFVEGERSELKLRLLPSDAPLSEQDAGPVPDSGPEAECVDEDGDGYGEGPGCLGPDCDDENDGISPGASETCNGEDDDCDLLIDEGCPCDVGQSHLCSSLLGECRYGAQICRGGEWSDECVGGELPREEVCDGRDNDCDGTTDEGC